MGGWVGGGWLGGCRYIIMPLRGPTCKITIFVLIFSSYIFCRSSIYNMEVQTFVPGGKILSFPADDSLETFVLFLLII